MIEPALEQQAIGQAGERIVVGLVVEPGLGVLEGGDIGEDADEVSDLALRIVYRADGQPFGVQLAGLASVQISPCQCPSRSSWFHMAR